jgi:uncharacterized protein with PIN domain
MQMQLKQLRWINAPLLIEPKKITILSRGRSNMLSLSTPHHETCPRCGSGLVSLEWDERVNAREIQDLWRCWKCRNEFITVALSDEKAASVPEITKPFFTSLLME